MEHVSVDFYKEKDYFPDALVNYVALLGWSPASTEKNSIKDEVFKLSELVEMVDLMV